MRPLFSDTVGRTIYWWVFTCAVLAGVAGLFINFVSAEVLLLPAIIMSLVITSHLVWLWFDLLKRRPDVFPKKRGIKYRLLITCAFCMFGVLLLPLFFVTLPAIATDLFGTRYESEDLVLRLEDCSGRRCFFCRKGALAKESPHLSSLLPKRVRLVEFEEWGACSNRGQHFQVGNKNHIVCEG